MKGYAELVGLILVIDPCYLPWGFIHFKFPWKFPQTTEKDVKLVSLSHDVNVISCITLFYRSLCAVMMLLLLYMR